MSEIDIDIIASLMRNTNIVEGGVSFKGEKLVLDKEEDCKRIIDAIRKCENLEYFNLEGNTLGVEGSKAIAKALQSKSGLKRALWKDIFTGRTKEEIPQALVNLGNGLKLAGAQLTELDMSDNAFGPIGLEKLAGLLSSPTCYQLQVLKLHNNGLGISGGKMLADALLCCHERSVKEGKPFALKVFIAGRNRLENEGATAIAKVFKTLGSLEEVVLPQNGIYSKGIEALSKSFIGNKNLMVLNLNDNTLGKDGALSIAKALPHLQKLKVLNLGDCLLKTGGAEVLADALREKHTNLEELYMCSNEINIVGGLAIAEAVKNKDKLKVLSLNGNSFGVKGCECVRMKMEEIERISCLQSLSDDEGDEHEDSDENEEDCNNVSDGNESENDRSSEMSELSFNSANLTCTPKLDNKETDSLRHTFQHLSFNQNDMDSLNKFLNLPVIDNFKEIDKKVIANYVQMAQVAKEDSYSDKIIELIMKISQFSTCSEDKVKTLASEISYDLYKNLFSWAKDNNQTSAVTNSLMVYLGLIKSEDKKFKIDWKTEGCLSALEGAISKSILPESTKEILRCCMNREKTVTLTK